MKARFLALAALVLGLASCQNDPEIVNPVVGGEVDFQLAVGVPELGTRAATDGTNDSFNHANSAYGAIDYLQGVERGDDYRTDWGEVDIRYSLEVYDKADSYTDAVPVKDRQVIIKDSYEPVAFDLRLVPGREYHFVVFADFVKQGADANPAIDVQEKLGLHHNIGANLGQITIKNDGINDECTDAYFATKDITISNSAAQDMELKRPYGKLRVIATDLAELNINVDPKAVVVTYDAYHPNAFNAVTGAIGGEYVTENYVSVYNDGVCKLVDSNNTGLANHFYTEGYDNMKATNKDGVQRHTHMTLFTDYILANEQQAPIHFTMNVYQTATKNGEGYKFSNPIKETHFNTEIPIQRNFLTTIVGNVLTTATEIKVTIDDNFDGENSVHHDPNNAEEALKQNHKNIYVELADDVALNGNGVKWGGEDTELIVIDGKKLATFAATDASTGNHTLTFNTTYRLHIETVNPDAKVILRNLNVTTNKESGTWDTYDIQFNCNVEIENVNFQKAIAFVKDGQSVSIKNATINETHDYYAMWISAVGQTVNIENLVVNSEGRGIKIDEEYVDAPAKVTLNINNAKFTTKKKAAIMVKSVAGADITLSNVDITGVAADSSNEVWIDEDAANTINKVNVIGGSMIVEGQKTVAIADMETLKEELTKAGQAGAGYTVLEISSDIDMTGAEWTPIKVDGYNGADIVTIDGKGHTIKGLTSSLFAGGFAGGSGIVIKNLTIADSKMVADNTQGYGAFVNTADSMDVITLVNCHLKNSSIITPNDGANESRIGGLVGWTAGYDKQNDGPVDSYITIENCSVVGCTLTGAGSIGAICGHAGANAATFTTINNCTITNNKLISTDNGGWRTGVVVGTANNGQCVISNITESGNTLTQASASDFKNPTGATRHYYGRFVPAGTGHLTIEGVEITAGITLIADGVFKKDAENAYYVTNANGLAALNAMMVNQTAGKAVKVTLGADIDFAGKTWTPIDSHADSKFTFAELNGQGHTISNLTINGQAMFTRFAGVGDVVIKDITFDNANVNSNSTINTSILTVHSYQNVLLDNVDVKNSTIIGGYKVAPLIATVYNENPSTTITATLKNCDVDNVTVKATSYDFCTTGMVAFVYEGDNDRIVFENCSVKDVQLYAPNAYTAHAAIYTAGSETLYNEAEGVVVENVTFENI